MSCILAAMPSRVCVASILLLTATVGAPQQSLPAQPTMKTFKSAGGLFEFSHPADFRVCTAGKIRECIDSYIPVCEEDAILCAVYPSKKFEGTSFGAAAFQVREVFTGLEKMTPDVCVTPSTPEGSQWPEFQISARDPAVKIGGVLFVHGTTSQAAMSHSSSVDLYRAFHQDKCYELSISQTETNAQVFDPPARTLTRAQRKDVNEKLSQMLHSFRFLK